MYIYIIFPLQITEKYIIFHELFFLSPVIETTDVIAYKEDLINYINKKNF